MTVDARDLGARLDGLLSFPVTAFDADGGLDLTVFARHVEDQVRARPAALFVCCGTGEFHALSPQEHQRAVATAVDVASGRLPVLAGVGYGTALARQLAASAVDAGADGLLVLPPYLVQGSQEGLLQHYRAVADAAGVGVVIYQRDVRLDPTTVVELARHESVVGLKDGLGDLDRLQRTLSAVRADERGRHEGSPLVFLNGLPTAEITALAYRGLGITSYSSAVHCFAPDVARDFYDALERGDLTRLQRWHEGFYVPWVELRDQGSGYPVSLVKAAVCRTGLDVGPVRPPLTAPAPQHLLQLESLLVRAQELRS